MPFYLEFFDKDTNCMPFRAKFAIKTNHHLILEVKTNKSLCKFKKCRYMGFLLYLMNNMYSSIKYLTNFYQDTFLL